MMIQQFSDCFVLSLIRVFLRYISLILIIAFVSGVPGLICALFILSSARLQSNRNI